MLKIKLRVMSLYVNALNDFKENYLGYIALAIIGQSCLGSAAVMYVLKNGTSLGQMFQLGMVVIICMLVNGAVLSQQKAKIVFNLLLISVFLNIVFIVLNTLFLG